MNTWTKGDRKVFDAVMDAGSLEERTLRRFEFSGYMMGVANRSPEVAEAIRDFLGAFQDKPNPKGKP